MTKLERFTLFAAIAEAVGNVQWDRMGLADVFLIFDENGMRHWDPVTTPQDTYQVATYFGLCLDFGGKSVRYSVGELTCERRGATPETLALAVCQAASDILHEDIALIALDRLSLRKGDAVVVRLLRPSDAHSECNDLLRSHPGVREALAAGGIPLAQPHAERPTTTGMISCRTLNESVLEYTWQLDQSRDSQSPCNVCNGSGYLQDGTTADSCYACQP